MESSNGSKRKILKKRKAALKVTFCVKKGKCVNYKKVSTILQKPLSDRTTEDLDVLNKHKDVTKEVTKRMAQRQRLKDRAQEYEDPPDILTEKCKILAEALSNSNHLVVYTGAGISTAARIPDYRGANGIWTLLEQGKDIGLHDLSLAEPTLTHMALYCLYQAGLLKHIVSQNCDGLHLRSGLPRPILSEVHGNMYIEVCLKCKPFRHYLRLFDVTERTARFNHKTLRLCYKCNGPLKDTIVHFGERGQLQWPLNWKTACEQADQADVILCLGSSLKVLKRYPWLWSMDKRVNKRPKLYIVNLQWTPKDDHSTLKINGKCDDVLEQVMSHLGLSIPKYVRSLDPIFYHATALHDLEMHTMSQPFLQHSNLPLFKRESGISNNNLDSKIKNEFINDNNLDNNTDTCSLLVNENFKHSHDLITRTKKDFTSDSESMRRNNCQRNEDSPSLIHDSSSEFVSESSLDSYSDNVSTIETEVIIFRNDDTDSDVVLNEDQSEIITISDNRTTDIAVKMSDTLAKCHFYSQSSKKLCKSNLEEICIREEIKEEGGKPPSLSFSKLHDDAKNLLPNLSLEKSVLEQNLSKFDRQVPMKSNSGKEARIDTDITSLNHFGIPTYDIRSPFETAAVFNRMLLSNYFREMLLNFHPNMFLNQYLLQYTLNPYFAFLNTQLLNPLFDPNILFSNAYSLGNTNPFAVFNHFSTMVKSELPPVRNLDVKPEIITPKTEVQKSEDTPIYKVPDLTEKVPRDKITNCSFCSDYYNSHSCVFYNKYSYKLPESSTNICLCCSGDTDEDEEVDEDDGDVNANDEAAKQLPKIQAGWFGKGYRKRVKKRKT